VKEETKGEKKVLKLNTSTQSNIKSSRLSGAVFFMICLTIIFSSIAYGAVDAWAFGLLSVFAALIIFFWVIDAWVSGELVINTNLIQIPLLGIIVIGFIQLLPLRGLNFSAELLSVSADNALTLDPYSTKLAILKYIIFFIVFAASLTFINTNKRLQKIVFIIIIFAAFMAFYGILQNLAGADSIYGLRPVPNANPFSAYVNRHHFAAFMEMVIGLALGVLFSQGIKKDKLLLLIIGMVLMGIAIVMTGSRGGFISLLGVLSLTVLLTILYGNKKDSREEKTKGINTKNIIVVVSSIFLVIFLLVITIWLGAGNTIDYTAGNLAVADQDFTNGRIHFWTTTIEIIKDNPIIGTGLSAFGISFTKYDSWNGSLRLEHAHNDYLQTLSDSGIIGFILILLFIFLLFKNALRVIATTEDKFRQGASIGALAGCFGILIHSLFDFPLRTNANSFFFLVLAAIAITTITYPKRFRRRRVKIKKKQAGTAS
jgi:O-antigen ligase